MCKPTVGCSSTTSIQPDARRAEYTTELLNLLNVLGLLVDLEPAAAALLVRICAVPLMDAVALREAGLFSDTSDHLTERQRKARAALSAPNPRTEEPGGS